MEARPHASRMPVDTVVLGGGIVGVASAAHLAAAGQRVVLLERDDIAAAASGRNSGVVQHPFDPALVTLHLETVERYRELGDRLAGGFRLAAEPVGLLLVTTDDAVAARVTRELAASHPGLRPSLLPAGEAHRLEPALSADVAACRLEIGYPVAPAAATRAYAAWAASLGVEIRTGTGARPWVPDGRCRGAIADDGQRIEAADVVVAAGPWSPALIDPTGAWRPIHAIWGVVVTVDLASPPSHVLEEAEIPIEPGAPGAMAPVDFSLVTADGSSSVGSTFLPVEPDAAALVPAIIERGRRFVPAIGRSAVGAHRLCARPVSDDGRPLLGRVPGIAGLWVAAGHGPWGISTGPASGRLIADLVTGAVGAPPPALDPGRFAAPV